MRIITKDDIMVLIQLLLNGIIAGGIYALIAIGFNMSYGLLRFLNIAHGALFMLGAYFAYLFFSMGMFIVIAGLIATIIVGFIGLGIDRFIYRQLRKNKASALILMLASFAILVLLENLVLAVFGADVKTIRTGPVQQGLEFFGAYITPIQIMIIVVSILTMVSVFLFLRRTKLGKAMRATADNKDVAQVIGIDTDKIIIYVAFIAAILAALAGVLVGIEQNLEPTMGFFAVINGLIAAVVGGAGSVRGAVAGGFLLGIAENIGVWFVPSGFKLAIAFTILIVFLIFRPKGIFGDRFD